MVCRNPAPCLAGARSPFVVFVFDFLAIKLHVGHTKMYPVELGFLPLLAIAPPL
jgi:hypothetical protein